MGSCSCCENSSLFRSPCDSREPFGGTRVLPGSGSHPHCARNIEGTQECSRLIQASPCTGAKAALHTGTSESGRCVLSQGHQTYSHREPCVWIAVRRAQGGEHRGPRPPAPRPLLMAGRKEACLPITRSSTGTRSPRVFPGPFPVLGPLWDPLLGLPARLCGPLGSVPGSQPCPAAQSRMARSSGMVWDARTLGRAGVSSRWGLEGRVQRQTAISIQSGERAVA